MFLNTNLLLKSILVGEENNISLCLFAKQEAQVKVDATISTEWKTNKYFAHYIEQRKKKMCLPIIIEHLCEYARMSIEEVLV